MTRRLHRGLELGANYTFSRTWDTTSGSPQDVYDIARDYALASIHRAHNFNGHFIWRLPFFGDASSRLVRGALSGWDVTGVIVCQSGAPFTVTAPVDSARIGVNSTRATLIGGSVAPGERANAAALVQYRRLPRSSRVDLGILKGVKVAGRVNLQLRADAFNAFNTVSFTGLNTTVRFDAAGNPAGGYGQVTSAAPGRVLEFGVRLTF